MKLATKSVILIGALFFNTAAGLVAVSDPHRSFMSCLFGASIFGALITFGMFIVGYICVFSVSEKDVDIEKITHRKKDNSDGRTI